MALFSLIHIFKEGLIGHKCLFCNENYEKRFDRKLKDRFFNTSTFCNHNKNMFVLLLQIGVYTWENMNDWERLNETSNMEDITDADYMHIKEFL